MSRGSCFNIATFNRRKALVTLKTHCYLCHSQLSEKPRGNFKLDQLTSNFEDRSYRDAWQLVFKKIKSGEMPPKEKTKPTEKESLLVFDWINSSTKLADVQRLKEGRVVLRKLNNIEYENTMRDLLGVPVELRGLLTQDSSSNGFDNIGEALHTSSFLMDKYLEGAN